MNKQHEWLRSAVFYQIYPQSFCDTDGIGRRDGKCATNDYSCRSCLNDGFEHPAQPYISAADSPETQAARDAMLDVMRFWLKMGCDGLQVDMAGLLVKCGR